jgi:hypothetical protein
MHTHRKMSAWLAMAVIALGLSSAAMADDLQPPPYRGQPNSTYAHFVYQDIAGLQLVGFNQPGGGDPPYTDDPDGTGPIQAGGGAQIIFHQPITPEGDIYDIYVAMSWIASPTRSSTSRSPTSPPRKSPVRAA